jgi:potassium-dependent mechanosensitive channel
MELAMQTLQISRQTLRGALVIGLAVALFLLSAVSVKTAEQPAPESPKVSSPMPSAPIPVAEVATQATEVANFLRQQETQFAPSPAMGTIRAQLPKVSGHIDLLLDGTTEILQGQPPLATLQAQRQIWEAMQLQVTAWLKVLTERATQLGEALDRLEVLQKNWTSTRDAAQAANAPGTILQQIQAVLAAIENAQSSLQAHSSNLLELQSRAAAAAGKCENVLAQIAQAQKQAVGGLLVRDRPPVWKGALWSHARTALPGRIREIAEGCWADIQEYLSNFAKGMPLHAGLFMTLTLALCAARRRVQQWKASGEGVSSASAVLDRPYAAALLTSVLVATGPASPTPPTVQSLLEILALAPMIRLTRPVVDPRMITGFYALALLFPVDTIRQTLDGAPLLGQIILILEALAGSLMLGWSLAYGNLRHTASVVTGSAKMRTVRVGATLVLLSLTVGLAAGALGYMPLARLLTSEIFAGGALALASYSLVLVLNGVVAFALRVWPLRLLQMVRHHRGLLEHRIYRLLLVMAILGWAARLLQHLGLLGPALSLAEAILATNLERGSINISLGDVLVFLLTVWAAYLLSAFIRFVLQEDVYPRTRIAPGLSYAISNLLHYLILALGLVVGMGLMGIDLSRLTVLAGAFGVGIGFGLQSVVNNFVCGLILLFERPIHVGDMIEVGDLLGEVRRIGIRASTVRTRQGSDMIVPNTQLVTDKVTNWTLSDKLRRISLPVGVNYSAAPEEVIELLVKVARAHPQVLPKPEPYALFMSYGDSSINFELRAWTDEYLHWRHVLSDLGVAVHDAVLEAGMTFPFPQREVRLLQGSKAGPAEDWPIPKPEDK